MTEMLGQNICNKRIIHPICISRRTRTIRESGECVSMFNTGDMLAVETHNDRVFGNEFTTIFCLIEAAKSGKSIIHVLSEDKRVWPTDVLGVSGGDGMQGADGAVEYVKAGPPCLQKHGMPSAIDPTSIRKSYELCAKHLVH